MEVHKILGSGFLEAVYQEALAIEFKENKIQFIEHPKLSIKYKAFTLNKYYVPDFLCTEEIIVEIKAMSQYGPNENAQIINALKAAKKKVGVLINFGQQSLYWKRFVNSGKK